MRAIFEALGVQRRGREVGRHLQPAQHDQGDLRRAGAGRQSPRAVAARRGKKVSDILGRREADGTEGGGRAWLTTARTVTVTQIGSPIGRTKDQRATLVGLGLNKLHRTRELRGHARRCAA